MKGLKGAKQLKELKCTIDSSSGKTLKSLSSLNTLVLNVTPTVVCMEALARLPHLSSLTVSTLPQGDYFLAGLESLRRLHFMGFLSAEIGARVSCLRLRELSVQFSNDIYPKNWIADIPTLKFLILTNVQLAGPMINAATSKESLLNLAKCKQIQRLKVSLLENDVIEPLCEAIKHMSSLKALEIDYVDRIGFQLDVSRLQNGLKECGHVKVKYPNKENDEDDGTKSEAVRKSCQILRVASKRRCCCCLS